jgi:multicomponent Na+:H+ antiporter subunit E
MLQGLIVGIITLIFINILFKDQETLIKRYHLSLFSTLKYIAVVFINIYKSTFNVIKLIIFDDIHPVVVEINTKVEGEWPRCLVANGITLTPGTVTIDQRDERLTVLWLMPADAKLEDAKAMIQDHFEKALIKKEKKHA